jgi:hypothetical protein
VKYAIPLGAILLIGISACLHRKGPRPATPERRGELGQVIPSKEALEPDPGEKRVGNSLTLQPETIKKQNQPEAAPLSRPGSVSSWRKMSVLLEHDLSLSLIQQATLEQILRDREEEIRVCHDAIRRAALLDMRHYEWQVGLMKASWYRKVDGLLDGIQHVRLVALVEQGLFNEGLAFTEEPGMTVLD